MQQKLDIIKASGAQLLAISPMLREVSSSLVKKLGLQFPVLCDSNNNVAAKFGLVYRLAKTLEPIYDDLNIDIPGSNGDNTFRLPLPATYIINTKGEIRYSFVEVDHTLRLDPEVMMEEISKL